MTHSAGFTPIAGSEREPLQGAKQVAPVDPNSEVSVSVVLRRREDPAERLSELARSEPALRRHLTSEELAARYGADPADLAKVEEVAKRAGLTVLESSPARRTVVLRGTAKAMGEAFDVELAEYEHPRLGRYRGRTGTVAVPSELDGVVEAVLGLDNRPQAEPRIARSVPIAAGGGLPSGGGAPGIARASSVAEAPSGGGAPGVAGASSVAEAPSGGGAPGVAGASSVAEAPSGSGAPGVAGASGVTEAPSALHAGAGAASATAGFTPPEVAAAYSFPFSLAPGQNQCIALIELGGGYRESDLNAYFQKLGISAPTVVAVGVDGAGNSPGSNSDFEVVLDIEVTGSIANHATIVVYFAPNTAQGFLDAITAAVHDTKYRPSVVSISWGNPESLWTEQGLNAFDAAFADAALLGITVCCAAGDHGSADGVSDGHAHADFPASSPHALGCGGTHLETKGATISLENVWNNNNGWATGGGVSDHFALPSWQAGAKVPPSVNPGAHVGRGVPDVAGDADPNSGYRIHLNGQDYVTGGTSAVAPLWGALVALMNNGLARRLGLLNPTLYAWPAPQWGFQDIVSGKNEVTGTPGYSAAVGWDACTGLGSPNGRGLMRALLPQFLLQTGVPISEQDAAEHFAGYAVAPYGRDGLTDLYGLKTKSTGTGRLEVHTLARASNYQSFLLHTGTPITEQDAVENFAAYGLADYNRDGYADLYCLKDKATGTGRLEVHILSGANNFQSFLMQTGTPILEQDAAANFVGYALGDYNGDGRPDLFCLKARATGTGRLELHILSGASNYQSFLLQTGLPISEQDAAEYFVGYAVGPVDGDGRADLFCLKARETGTGLLEVHVLSAASKYQSFLIQTGTPISEQDAAAHFTGYALGDYNADGYQDLFCLKARETGTGKLEVHVLNGARYYTP